MYNLYGKVLEMINELLKENRSIREFDRNYPVSKKELEDMVEITRFCASSANMQALKYRLVYDKAQAQTVFENVKWAGYIKGAAVPAQNNECGAFIIVCLDTGISGNDRQFAIDTGIASQSMALKAKEAGLGCCMLTSFSEKPIKEKLGIDEKYKIMLVLAVGKPKEQPVITDCNGDIKYYRKDGVHYVPKRSLEEILI